MSTANAIHCIFNVFAHFTPINVHLVKMKSVVKIILKGVLLVVVRNVVNCIPGNVCLVKTRSAVGGFHGNARNAKQSIVVESTLGDATIYIKIVRMRDIGKNTLGYV